MEYFWAILTTFIVLMILYGIVSSRIKNRRMKKEMAKLLPTLTDHIQADKSYNIFLSHGQTLKNVTFLGISETYDNQNPYMPFPLCQWLVVKTEAGKKAYIKPATVRYYEEA